VFGVGAWSGGHRSRSGERVNWATTIGLDAVAACVGLMTDVAYMLPLGGYRDQQGVATKLAAAPQLVANPSRVVDARTWRAQAVVSWMLWGNAYGLVLTRDQHGYPTTVEWLWPEQVSVEETSILEPAIYRVAGQQIRDGDLLHVPGRYVVPGSRVGLVPLERFKETFGLALAARNFGAQWFGDGAHPSSILKTDAAVDEPTARKIKDRFVAAIRGRREPAVLSGGITYEQVQVTPDDSQFIQTQQQAVTMVARAMGILQPEMIGAAVAGSSITYSNREQRAIDFLTFSADPYLVRVEEMVTRQLPRPQYAKYARGALLRTDLTTRYNAHDTAIRGGWRSPDEARALEDEPPIPDGGGDRYLWPPYAVSETAPSTGGST
jgi:HK97 family phage portal protein